MLTHKYIPFKKHPIRSIQNTIIALAFYSCLFLLFSPIDLSAQAPESKRIEGQVIDARTGEPLPYTNILFLPKKGNKHQGEMTSIDGRFSIPLTEGVDSLLFSFSGYHEEYITIGKRGRINLMIKMRPKYKVLQGVEISAKKERYKNKENPAVILMRKAIANKKNNRIEHRKIHQYKKHEKIQFSLNNVEDTLNYKWLRKNFSPLFDNIDTSESTGNPYLPIYFLENLSEHYYHANKGGEKILLSGSKDVEISSFIDPQTAETMMREVFGEINVYDKDVFLLSRKFMSPFNTNAPLFYKFFIVDTVPEGGFECIRLTFMPRNHQDVGFWGVIFLTNDKHLAIKRIELRLTENVNLNYVDNLLIRQEFEKQDGSWVLSKDILSTDFKLYNLNLHGRRENTYDAYLFDTPQSDDIYAGVGRIVKLPQYNQRSDGWWAQNRISPLRRSEFGTYNMMQRLEEIPKYKYTRDIILSLIGGYWKAGKIDVGPIESMLSFNSIEGARLRIGGKTNKEFHDKWFFDGFLAYGTRDNRFKYEGSVMYSFSDHKYNQWEFPMNLITFTYSYNTLIPSQGFIYGSGDRLTLSIGRGKTERMIFEQKYSLKWDWEFQNGISLRPLVYHQQQHPLGDLSFRTNSGNVYDPLTISALGLDFKFAPNEKYYQSQKDRFAINNTGGRFEVNYRWGINNLLGSHFDFHKLETSFAKRIFFVGMGFLDFKIKGGYLWGSLPYPLLFIHTANQNFILQKQAFNMMNYLEFISDHYVSLTTRYNFGGLFFNRIPLIKRLHLREVVGFKAVWGNLRSENNPNLAKNTHLFPLTLDKEGNTVSYGLNHGPYMEFSVGVDNLFEFLEVHYIQRLSYLDNPGASKWAIRLRIHLSF